MTSNTKCNTYNCMSTGHLTPAGSAALIKMHNPKFTINQMILVKANSNLLTLSISMYNIVTFTANKSVLYIGIEEYIQWF